MIPPIDHILDGASKVVAQYRGRPRFLSRLACYLNQVQHIEDAVFALRDAFNPDTATGFRLDWVGRKVGQPRLGADDVFRLLIKARIRVNRSLGQIADLEAVCNLLLGSWTYYEWSTCIFVYTPDVLTADMREAIHGLLQAAAPAGVPIFFEQTDGGPAFEFAVDGADLTAPGGFDTEAGDDNAGLWSTIQ